MCRRNQRGPTMTELEQTTDGAADDAPKARRLALPRRLDLAAADELAEAFEHLRDSPVDVSAHEVTHLGTLCLQVLLAARAQWRLDGTRFALRDPSDAFLKDMAALGVPAEALTGEARA